MKNEVDWSLYKGLNTKKQMDGYVKFYNRVISIGGKLLTEYKGTEHKVYISMNDKVEFYITPHKFNDRTYQTFVRFKNKLLNNGEEFIDYVKYIENTGLTASIKTIDGIIIDINIGSYDSFCESRIKTITSAKEIGFKVKNYISNSKHVVFYNDYFKFETTPNKFKTQTYKSAINFINSLKCGDDFVEFVNFIDEKCLVAKIKNKFNTYQDVSLSSYNVFNTAREEFYNYCKCNDYKVLSAYKGNTESILIDIGCEHGEFITTPKSFIKSKYGCPQCVSFKGDKNPNWNPKITQEERENGRFIDGYNEFIRGVYERDNYTCQCCSELGNGSNLNAHHLDGYNWCKDKRTDIDNGITLCSNCHKEFHRIYGKGNNTKEQYEQFKQNKIKEIKEVS